MKEVILKRIELDLILGQTHTEVDGVRVPLQKWELSAKLTTKQKDIVARQNALEIYALVKQ